MAGNAFCENPICFWRTRRMKNPIKLTGHLLSALLIMALAVAGCGGNSPDSDFCGPNTSWDGDRCIAADPVECGLNSELDPNTNTCFATNTVCGENTAYDSATDQCLPTEDICSPGTYFNDEQRLCFPSSQCQPGDVVVAGVCLTPAEALASNADVIANGEDSRPFPFGTPHTLPVGELNEETIFAGTIVAPTRNEEGAFEQHYDFFIFNAQEGDWFEISLQSLGLPAPHFRVWLASDGEITAYRDSALLGNATLRQITIPYDSFVLIQVMPQSHFLFPELTFGGDDYKYVGTLKQLPAPSPENHSFEADGNLSGKLGLLTENFFKASGFEPGETVIFTMEEEPQNAEHVLQVWTTPTDFLRESSDRFSITVPPSGEFFLVADWLLSLGTEGMGYELSAQPAQGLEPGDTFEMTFTANANDVAEILQSNANGASLRVTVVDENGSPVFLSDGAPADVQLSSVSGDQQPTDPVEPTDPPDPFFPPDPFEPFEPEGPTQKILRLHGLDAGTYTVTFENTSSSWVDDLTPSINLISPTPLTDLSEVLTAAGSESITAPQNYFLIELPETTTLELELTNLTPTAGGVRLFLYQGSTLLYRTDPEAFQSNPISSTSFTFQANTPYLLRIGNDWPNFDLLYQAELRFVELTELASEDFTINSIADVVQFTQTNENEESLEISLYNEDTGELVGTVLKADGEPGTLFNAPPGNYRAVIIGEATWTSAPVITITFADVIASETFTVTDSDERFFISQSNSEDAPVHLAIIEVGTNTYLDTARFEADAPVLAPELPPGTYEVEVRSFDNLSNLVVTIAPPELPAEVLVSDGLETPADTPLPYPGVDTFVPYDEFDNGTPGSSSYREFLIPDATALLVEITASLGENDILYIGDPQTGQIWYGMDADGASGVRTESFQVPSEHFFIAIMPGPPPFDPNDPDPDPSLSITGDGWRVDAIFVAP